MEKYKKILPVSNRHENNALVSDEILGWNVARVAQGEEHSVKEDHDRHEPVVSGSPGQNRGPDVQEEAVFGHETFDSFASTRLRARRLESVGQIGTLDWDIGLGLLLQIDVR